MSLDVESFLSLDIQKQRCFTYGGEFILLISVSNWKLSGLSIYQARKSEVQNSNLPADCRLQFAVTYTLV